MKKYKLKIKEQEFTFEDLDDFQNKIKNLMSHGVLLFETEIINDDTEEKPLIPEEYSELEEEEKPVPDKPYIGGDSQEYVEPKKPKRNRRTKEEMVSDGEQSKEQGVLDKRTKSKYPDELKKFIEDHMETTTNPDLVDLINEEFDFEIKIETMKNYMQCNNLRRKNVIRTPRRRKEEMKEDKSEKKMGPKKKWTDEVIQFLEDNVNNFSNAELCEMLAETYDIKVSIPRLSSVLSQKGIKRDHKEKEENPEIVEFIKEQKSTDAHAIRDKVIEKFEVNMTLIDVRKHMEEDLPGENPEDEAKRIQEKREEPEELGDDEDIDGLGLDD